MKAAVLYEPFQPLKIEDLTLEAPREREVLVKIAASGVCHSDLHYIKEKGSISCRWSLAMKGPERWKK